MKPPQSPPIPRWWPFPVPVRAEYLRHQKEAMEAFKAFLDKFPQSPM